MVAARLLVNGLSYNAEIIEIEFLETLRPILVDTGALLAICSDQDDRLIEMFSSLVTLHALSSTVAAPLTASPLIHHFMNLKPSKLLLELTEILDASTLLDMLLESEDLVDSLLLALELADSLFLSTVGTLGQLYQLLERSRAHFPYDTSRLLTSLSQFDSISDGPLAGEHET